MKEKIETKEAFYPMSLRIELPVNFFLGKVESIDLTVKSRHRHRKVYSQMHNTDKYPVGTFQKPISNIL
jgi:hypothetical protein